MNPPRIVLAVRALRDRLKAIAIANGYHTDLAARVYTGRAALAIGEGQVPCLCVHHVTDGAEDADQPADRIDQSHIRDLVIEGKVIADADYDEALSALLFDIRAAIAGPLGLDVLGGQAVQTVAGQAVFFPPEAGSNLASVQLPVRITHVDLYQPTPEAP